MTLKTNTGPLRVPILVENIRLKLPFVINFFPEDYKPAWVIMIIHSHTFVSANGKPDKRTISGALQ